MFPSTLLEKHQGEIRRFAWVVKFLKWTAPLFALVPIKVSLRMFFFSSE